MDGKSSQKGTDDQTDAGISRSIEGGGIQSMMLQLGFTGRPKPSPAYQNYVRGWLDGYNVARMEERGEKAGVWVGLAVGING